MMETFLELLTGNTLTRVVLFPTLAALPLIALPIVIHLINQYRHRTVPWAAMMFLLRARRMNQGMARLRYMLIMLMRMTAITSFMRAPPLRDCDAWRGA